MKCRNCQAEIGEDSRFCRQCGAPVPETVQCPCCGKEVKATAKFCSGCGFPMEEIPVRKAACLQCGSEIPADAAFCKNCGASVKAVPVPKKQKKQKMGLWIALTAVMAVLLILLVVFLFRNILGGFSREEERGREQTEQREEREEEEEEEAEEEEEEEANTEEARVEEELPVEETTTEETTEEETEAEAPMEEPVELFLWINGDIYALAEEQNLTVEWSVSERLVAQNDALRVSSKPNSTEIEMISLMEESAYRILGLQIGMDMEDVEPALKEIGLLKETDRIYLSGDVVVSLSGEETLTWLDVYLMEEPVETEYLLPESNTRYLTEADLEPLTHEELCFARNEIYARHGWIFSVKEIADFFAEKSWYQGTTLPANFSESVMNEYERANVSFIGDYEDAHYGGSYY